MKTKVKRHRRRTPERITEHSRAAMALNLWLKTDDFPFNTPLSSLLFWVLPGTLKEPLLSICLIIIIPQTIHPTQTCRSIFQPQRHPGQYQIAYRTLGGRVEMSF